MSNFSLQADLRSRRKSHFAHMTATNAVDEGGIPPRQRTTYYAGDADRPKQYVVWLCECKSLLHARNTGKKGEQNGCGALNICYTAKHWGWPSKNQAWQGKCSHCGKRKRLNRGYAIRIFDTRAEAFAYRNHTVVQREKDRLVAAYFNASNQMKNVRRKILREHCEEFNLPYFAGDYQ